MRHLHQQISSLPAGRVELMEREVPHGQLPGIYTGAAIFAFPSIWDEPFGMPLVEAMASGCAVVATHNGAFGEIVADGATGLLVERANPQALADAIVRLCQNDDLRLRLAVAGQYRARQRFDWDRTADGMLDVYESAIAARRDALARV